MNEREKVAHLLRRFGLGATPEEIDAGAKLGVEQLFEQMLADGDDGYPVSPWEFCYEEGKDEIYLDPFRVIGWWSLRMVMTKKPLHEKLTLFWHDHFAVSGSKVEFGPMLLDYLVTLRSNALGSFPKLLHAVSKDPAMMFWLDTMANEKGRPNENFAREVLELFTVGIGNYTERDIREAARAFTGWGIRYLLYEQGGEKVQEVAKECARTGRPMTVFAYSPTLHDDGPKTVLGKTANFTGEQVLDELALRPETAKHLTRKLWEFFAYREPEPAVVERLARVFTQSKGEIKSVLRAIVASPEFWSERCVRKQVKSPVDFTVGIVRQLNLTPFLLSVHGLQPHPQKPLEKTCRDIANIVLGLSYQQGMLLLYPPDVAGWEWGNAWITSSTMTHRLRLGELMMGMESKDYGGAGVLAGRIVALGPPANPEQLVDCILKIFDAAVTPEAKAVMVQACSKAGGPGTLNKPETAAPTLAAVLKLLFAAPEFQFC